MFFTHAITTLITTLVLIFIMTWIHSHVHVKNMHVNRCIYITLNLVHYIINVLVVLQLCVICVSFLIYICEVHILVGVLRSWKAFKVITYTLFNTILGNEKQTLSNIILTQEQIWSMKYINKGQFCAKHVWTTWIKHK